MFYPQGVDSPCGLARVACDRYGQAMTAPDFTKPFVLPVPAATMERIGNVDLYLPVATGPAPAIVFVHGGPLPAALTPRPRDWPVFQGYAALAADQGAFGVTLNHGFHEPHDLAVGAADIGAAVELVRADPRVDPDRIALWFFSGGGLLAGDWLRNPPSWLRCVGLTYPLLGELPNWPLEERWRADLAVAGSGRLPIVMTRVGREAPQIAVTVTAFTDAAEAAGANLEIIDVPNGRHSFDLLDHTDESRAAVQQAMTLVVNALA